MSKISSISLAIILSSCGFGFSQVATATILQTRPLVVKPPLDRPVDVKNVPTVTIAKKCTIRRYRRPH